MKGNRRNTGMSGGRLPRLSKGDRLKHTHMQTVYDFVNRGRASTLITGTNDTKRIRARITVKDSTTLICSGVILYNSSATGVTWSEYNPTKELLNIIDDDNALSVGDETWIHFWPQDGNWHSEASSGNSETGPTGDQDDGDFRCCSCDQRFLYVAAQNPDISIEKITDPKSIVDSVAGTIQHQIRVTCNASDPPVSQDITLDPIDCSGDDCRTLDMTGVTLGACDIGLINYGNNANCLVDFCPSRPSTASEPLQVQDFSEQVGADSSSWLTTEFETTFDSTGTITVGGLTVGANQEIFTLSLGGGLAEVQVVRTQILPISPIVVDGTNTGQTLSPGDVIRIVVTRTNFADPIPLGSSIGNTEVFLNGVSIYTGAVEPFLANADLNVVSCNIGGNAQAFGNAGGTIASVPIFTSNNTLSVS